MIIALTGAHGFVGQALVDVLQRQRLHVRPIPRTQTADGPQFDWTGLTGADAIIHLAGRNIANRWTPTFKAAMRRDRAAGIEGLQAALRSVPNPPHTVVIASAIGHYGETWYPATEDAPRGHGFPAEICALLEGGTYPPGTRVVHARLGVVLHPKGGALAKMLPAFRLGLGGPVGSGQQIVSWISRADACAALLHAVRTPSLKGPVNLVAPQPVPQAELARELARALYRPALLPMPAFMVKLLFGEMGEELLLQSCAVSSTKLQTSGFMFQHPTLPAAMADIFSNKRK